MKTLYLIEKLREKTIITKADIERLARASSKYSKLILNRLKKQNLIYKVSENRYTTKTNPFVIATNIINPCYLSWWSASYYYGFTEQIPNIVYVATTSRKKQTTFKGYQIKFIPTKNFFGYKKEKTNEGDIFIAEKEKLIIDVLLKPNYIGNFSEITEIIKNADISKDKLISYLKKINNQSLTKRIGFLLEKLKLIDIKNSFRLDNNYIFLNQFPKKGKEINTKWRIKYDTKDLS